MRTLKLYATGSATGNAVAQLTLPSAAIIKAIQYNVLFDSITDNALARFELSRSSATEIAVNNSQQCCAEISVAGNFVTSGLAQPSVNGIFHVSLRFAQGQILYFHTVISGTLTYYIAWVLHY